jgi:hypothetical protein
MTAEMTEKAAFRDAGSNGASLGELVTLTRF